MRLIIAVLMLCPLIVPSLSLATEQAPSPARSASLDLVLDRAMAQNQIAGGVVVVGNHEGIIATSARGRLNASPGAPLLSERTIFDIASLTKVAATTPAVMKLLDEGKIHLNDPIARWFPEFGLAGHSDLTVLSLLTHTSGLDDIAISSAQPMQSAVRKAASQKHARAGSRFHYADINFILLGELVHRVSGQTLDAFCQEKIYGPLSAQETMFLPSRDYVSYIAPTSGNLGGVVQDGNARLLGGVAGHAGLFTSAYDLSRYARMILNGGVLDNKRIFSEEIVAQMSTPHACNNGSVQRGLGWDINSPYSAPKGSYFSDASFGHTGYSGSSIWIDPKEDLFVILLTRRVNYSDTRSFNHLRREISTVAAADFRMLPGADHGAARIEVAKADLKTEAKIVEAAATTDIEVFVKDGVLVATNIPKEKPRPQAQFQRKLAKLQKLNAKACSVQRKGRVTRVAKAETRSSHSRKKRTVKS